MDKNQFTDMLAKPTRFTSQDRGWLRAMASKYPHSSVVSLLALLADHAYNYDTPEERRSVELSLCGDKELDNLLAQATQSVDDHSFDIFNEINNIQEVSFKTAPKSVILSNFLKIDSDESPVVDDFNPQTSDISDKKSLKADESLGTETLAIILEKQGKFDKALAIYKNLLAQNPEKNSTFAPRIAKLESLINSK